MNCVETHNQIFCDSYPCFRRGKLAPVETGVFFRLKCFEIAFLATNLRYFLQKKVAYLQRSGYNN